MSKSTAPTVGVSRLWHDLRFRRERFRQLIGILFAIFVSFLGRPIFELFYVGAPMVGIGILIRLWASGHVKKDKQLATTGPYGFVRHPLYVGNILIAFGFALSSSLWWSFLVLALILWLFYPPAIRQEDAKLEHLFGQDWRDWRARVRALLPRITPYSSERSRWSFKQSLMQNGEPIIAVFLCVLIYVLYAKLP